VNAPTVVAINRDLRYPRQIIEHPALQALIDLDQPVAILLVAVLHFIADHDDPYRIVDELKKAIPPGSYLVLSHVTSDAVSADVSHEVQQLYNRTNAAAFPRTRAGIARFFDGLEMVAPGLVDVRSWPIRSVRSELGRTIFLAGVGRKM
ncbi:MAG: SAM-dependent methyltransferase, partial [Actinomycetota bacterium]|nr:SAM-dependent methyltransferase [Actinomycetota bacterium]